MLSNRNLIIIISSLILVAGGFLIYYYYFQEIEPVDQIEDQLTNQTTSLGQIKRISQEPVLGTVIDNQKIRYYLKNNGNVFESSLNGSSPTIISSSVLPNLIKALWSPSKDKIIAIFNQSNKAKKYSYDYATRISTPLDSSIEWISWSPKEDKIAYQYNNPLTGDNSINIADSDGSNWTSVFQTRMKNLIVEWPKASQLSIRTRPSGLAESILYTIDLTNNDFEKIIKETFGLTTLWSPLGDKILYSETDNQGKNLKLKVLQLKNNTIKELNLITLPEKCVWSPDNRTIFCAVPKNISSHAIIPDDYYKKAISFSDDFYRINIETGEKTKIYDSNREETTYDANNILLSPLEDYLIFINQKDDLLYSLKL